MELKDKMAKAYKEFKLTTLALKNKNTVYLLAAILAIFGIVSYKNLPKELFPDIAFPYIMVNTVYFGNPPVDIENLLTRPIEKELESIKGIKEIRSTSAQDASMIFIEFNPNIQIEDALQEVRDAVDKARTELPNDLPVEPSVMDIDFSEFPIMNINLSGDYSIDELKRYGEILEEEIEKVAEISKVEITGITEKELKISVDQRKLQAYDMSFYDIESAIANENVSMSGGDIKLGETRRAIRIIGEFSGTKEIENIIVKHEDQNVVYLKDVAEVIDGFEDPNSFTRLNHQSVVALQVVKKGGENLLSANRSNNRNY
jgi:multidrug efflux pump